MNDTTTEREFEMIRELRESLGLFSGAMPISPAQAWAEAIESVKYLARPRRDPSGWMDPRYQK